MEGCQDEMHVSGKVCAGHGTLLTVGCGYEGPRGLRLSFTADAEHRELVIRAGRQHIPTGKLLPAERLGRPIHAFLRSLRTQSVEGSLSRKVRGSALR